MANYPRLTENEISDLLNEEFLMDTQTLQCHAETINVWVGKSRRKL